MQLSSQQGVQILHVDDDPSITDLTGTFLEREDDQFTIETATSADEGLERINDHPPDCVVSDYNMPGMDGIEFLQTVREEYPDLPFILFTGKGSEAVASDAISADVTDYLQKRSGTEQYELLANRIRNAVYARRETKRADRQEQLMRLTEFAGNTGGFELDRDSGSVLLTAGTRRIIGRLDQSEIPLEEAIELFHPDDHEEIYRTLDEAFETGEELNRIWRLQPDDGDQRLLNLTITPVVENGEVTKLRGAGHDITDREERERELTRLQQAIEDANVSITLADPSQQDEPLVFVNDGFEEMTGYPPEETLGRNCRFLQGEDTDPEKVATLREAIDNEEPVSVELRNYRKDGTEFWNRVTVTPIYNDEGELVRYLGTQEDVTERKERERELSEERRFIEQALDTLDDLFYVLDTDGTLRRWNDQAVEMTGYADSELADMQATELFPEDERETIVDAIETTLADGQATVEADLLTADGERVPYEFTGAQLTDEDGTVTGLVGVGRDLTERRQRERQLTELNQALQDLLTAETRQQVADIGVRAARDVLDLRANAVHLCEGDDTLTPVAQTDKLTAFLDEIPTLSVENSIAGRVYQRGEPTVVEDARQDPDAYNSETDLRGHIYLTLADHGILIASSKEKASFDQQDVAFGELLAGNLVAAFDRIDREQTARQRRERLSLFFEESPFGAVQWDDEFQFERVNRRAEEILGYSEAELRGESWEKVVAEADRGQVGDAVEALRASDGGTELLNRNVRKDGEVLTCEWHNRAVTGENGTVQSVVSKFQDVTERKERERELERQNDLFAKAQDIADVGAWAHDSESRTLTWTDHVYEMHDVSKEFDPSLEEVAQLYHPDDRPKLREAADQAVTAGKPYDLEVRMTAKDDGIRWIRTVADPQTENGEVVRVRGLVHDITDQKQREQEIRNLKRQYQTLLENFPNGAVYLIDKDLKYIRARGTELRRVGLSPASIEGKTPHDLLPEQIADETCHYYEQALEGTASTFEQEYRGQRYRIQTVPVRYDGEEITHLMAVAQNITEYAEDKRELERKNKRLEEFASIVSHDLRNPLTVAEGHLELAAETCESDHLARATDAIDRSQALIDDLLALAREGDRVDETEPVEIAEVAESSWQTVETQQATLDADESEVIEADRSRLQQLFENLYRNAVEHGGDDVTVSIGVMDDGFYLADSGPGIPESDREEVFEAGYSTNEDGAGFGLRIVEQVANAHGWEVAITESEEGGARFEITGVEKGA